MATEYKYEKTYTTKQGAIKTYTNIQKYTPKQKDPDLGTYLLVSEQVKNRVKESYKLGVPVTRISLDNNLSRALVLKILKFEK
tara:strand:+ start:6479 stop:6727 length:249 start_codon:yes stop_codon:yes gene_type:complete